MGALRSVFSSVSGRSGSLAQLARPAVLRERVKDRWDWLRLARALELSPCGELVHLGTAYGGYTIPDGLVREDWVCYCAGLGEEISFELELIGRYGCAVHAFDPTPRSAEYVSAIAAVEPKLHFSPVGLWSDDSIQRFFVPRDAKHVSHSIANLQETNAYIEVPCRRVSSLMHELKHDRIDLLKLDVEGAEYAVLDSLFDDGIAPKLLALHMHTVDSFKNTLAWLDRLRARGFVPVHVVRSDVTFVDRSLIAARS